MSEKRRKKSFLPAGCGGGFAGLMLWFALKKIMGESMTWWMGLGVLLLCIAIGLAFQAIDERRIEHDVVIGKKSKNESEIMK